MAAVLKSTTREHLYGLDGMRAVAVLAVVLYHEVSRKFPGRLGVLLFFVISGFLITRTMLRDEARGGFSLKRFYIRRAQRILPAFAAFLALHLVIYGHTPGLWSAALYVSNYYIAAHNALIPGLTHTWSLSVEEQFYVLWPLAFIFVRSRSSLSMMLGIISICVQVWRLGGVLLRANPYYMEFAFDMRCDALLLGCLVALTAECSIVQTHLHTKAVMRTLLWCSVAVIGLTSWAEVAHARLAMGVLYGPVAVAFGMVIVSASVLRTTPVPVLDNRFVRYVGRISYGLYLYHLLVFDALPEHLGFTWRLLCGGVGTFLIATVSYYLIEAPVLNLRSSRRNYSQVDRRLAAISLGRP